MDNQPVQAEQIKIAEQRPIKVQKLEIHRNSPVSELKINPDLMPDDIRMLYDMNKGIAHPDCRRSWSHEICNH